MDRVMNGVARATSAVVLRDVGTDCMGASPARRGLRVGGSELRRSPSEQGLHRDPPVSRRTELAGGAKAAQSWRPAGPDCGSRTVGARTRLERWPRLTFSA